MAALALIVNAFVWGLSWLPFRRLQDAGWHPVWTTGVVYLLLVIAWCLWRGPRTLSFARHPGLMALALASGLTNLCFNWGVTQGDVVRVVLQFYLMPLWSVLLAWALLGERPHAPAIARMALALAGVALVLKPPGMAWPVPASLPDWLGLAGGFFFALVNILLRRLRACDGEQRAMAMFAGCAGAGLIASAVGWALGLLAPSFLPPGASAGPDAGAAGALGWLLLLGGGLALANVCLQYGAVRLSAHTTSLLMLSEVLFASASSIALGAARMQPQVGVGGSLIVLAALWSALAEGRAAPRAARVAGASD